MTPEQVFERGKELLQSKAEDYTENKDVNRYENFDRSALLASWFVSDTDRAFVVLIATKLARLASLLNNNKTPKNESIEDSFVDLTNYCALWAGKRTSQMVMGRTCWFCGSGIVGTHTAHNGKTAHNACYNGAEESVLAGFLDNATRT